MMTPPTKSTLTAPPRRTCCPLYGPPLHCTFHRPFVFICLCLLQTPHSCRLPLPLSPLLIPFRRGAHSITLSARISVCPSFSCAFSQRWWREGKKNARGEGEMDRLGDSDKRSNSRPNSPGERGRKTPPPVCPLAPAAPQPPSN